MVISSNSSTVPSLTTLRSVTWVEPSIGRRTIDVSEAVPQPSSHPRASSPTVATRPSCQVICPSAFASVRNGPTLCGPGPVTSWVNVESTLPGAQSSLPSAKVWSTSK